MLDIYCKGYYIGVANSLYTFSSTPFLHDENLPANVLDGFLFSVVSYIISRITILPLTI